jgi:hypothetical protein
MTVKVTRDAINLREKLSELDKPAGIAGTEILRADTPQEVFNYINAGRRNLFINGDMRIDQRNGGASQAVTTSDSYCLDRFVIRGATGTGHALQQVSDAPSGFNYSAKFTVGTGGSPASTDRNYFRQIIEGYNFAHSAFGTSDAKTTTLSFWVKSSLTGTFSGAYANLNGTRAYPFTYTISSVNTWEYKTVTIAGDTSGTWDTTNGLGNHVYWDLGTGTNRQGTASAWAAADYRAASGCTQVVATSGATIQFTGVQLELGKVATPFEHRSYGEELALCKRYYEVLGRGGDWSGDRAYNNSTRIVNLPYWSVEKRADPSVTIYSNYGVANSMSNYSSGAENAVVALSDPSKYSLGRFITLTNAITAPHIGYFVADAEL